jgi:hypothetical protein
MALRPARATASTLELNLYGKTEGTTRRRVGRRRNILASLGDRREENRLEDTSSKRDIPEIKLATPQFALNPRRERPMG